MHVLQSVFFFLRLVISSCCDAEDSKFQLSLFIAFLHYFASPAFSLREMLSLCPSLHCQSGKLLSRLKKQAEVLKVY